MAAATAPAGKLIHVPIDKLLEEKERLAKDRESLVYRMVALLVRHGGFPDQVNQTNR